VKKVGLVVHEGREEAIRAARELVSWLRDRGLATAATGPAGEVGADEGLDASGPTAGSEDLSAHPDLELVVSIGGDGTFLRAAHLAASADCPVLGVKAGRMGFLTEVDPEDATLVLERVLEGRATIEKRMAVEAEPHGTDWRGTRWALNEFIVEKSARHRVIMLAAFIDGEYVATLSGDGIIVASPTGSTAYSFSARGPIVSPKVAALVVTPVAAHMVFDRSFVLDPREGVTLEVLGEEPGLLSGDGRDSLELPVGARVHIRAATRPARLVRREDGASFYRLVREKFDLPGNDRFHGGGTIPG
jgi:NAD+ kinase